MPARWITACLLLICSTTHAQVNRLAASTKPTSAPASTETLNQGTIIFTPPADWKPLGKRTDGRAAGYQMPDEKGQIVVTVTPEPQSIPDGLSVKLAAQLQEAIRKEEFEGNIVIVTPSKVESDKRFLLKLHDRFKAYGRFGDRIQFYRGVGKNLVSVVATAFVDDPLEAAKVHAIGESVMLSAKLNSATTRPAGPVTFTEAHLRTTPPSGWEIEATGNATGLIASWRNPADPSHFITLQYQVLPTTPRIDPAMKSAAIEQLAAGQTPGFQSADVKPIGIARSITDKRFLRKTQSDYEVAGVRLRIGFRQVRAGDGVVSITSVSKPETAAALESIADKIAVDTKSTSAN